MNTNCSMLGSLALLLAATTSEAGSGHVNTTAGGPLRAGVYGRIELGKAPPPPLIYSQPVVASRFGAVAGARPVYLYVPPGQVRKWASHCGKYKACELPVLFVRMDDSPGKLGKWKNRSRAEPNAGAVAQGTP